MIQHSVLIPCWFSAKKFHSYGLNVNQEMNCSFFSLKLLGTTAVPRLNSSRHSSIIAIPEEAANSVVAFDKSSRFLTVSNSKYIAILCHPKSICREVF